MILMVATIRIHKFMVGWPWPNPMYLDHDSWRQGWATLLHVLQHDLPDKPSEDEKGPIDWDKVCTMKLLPRWSVWIFSVSSYFQHHINLLLVLVDSLWFNIKKSPTSTYHMMLNHKLATNVGNLTYIANVDINYDG